MTDYYPLIARAVEGLDRSTGEARRALYERARNALVAQLRSNQPALSEAEITKERLALEEAIRKVEAEAARKSRNKSRAEQRTEPRAATAPAATPEGGAQVRRASEAPRRDRTNPPPADLPRARMDRGATQCARAVVERPVFAEETRGQRFSRRRRRGARSWRGNGQGDANRAPDARSL